MSQSDPLIWYEADGTPHRLAEAPVAVAAAGTVAAAPPLEIAVASPPAVPSADEAVVRQDIDLTDVIDLTERAPVPPPRAEPAPVPAPVTRPTPVRPAEAAPAPTKLGLRRAAAIASRGVFIGAATAALTGAVVGALSAVAVGSRPEPLSQTELVADIDE